MHTKDASHNKQPVQAKKEIKDPRLIKDYRLLERRALLQSVRADEVLIEQLDGLEPEHKSTDMSILLFYLRQNAENRRKAFLQIVRGTEKEYDLKKK